MMSPFFHLCMLYKFITNRVPPPCAWFHYKATTMSSKLTSLFIIASLLLFFTVSGKAARPDPSFSDATPMKIQHGVVDEAEVEVSCAGIGEEECLMRRTLAAHIDYIYTQKKNP